MHALFALHFYRSLVRSKDASHGRSEQRSAVGTVDIDLVAPGIHSYVGAGRASEDGGTVNVSGANSATVKKIISLIMERGDFDFSTATSISHMPTPLL